MKFSTDDLLTMIDDMVDRGLTRAASEEQAAEWARDFATSLELDEIITFRSPVLERADGPLLLLIVRGIRAISKAAKRDPVKLAARRVRRAERKAAREAAKAEVTE